MWIIFNFLYIWFFFQPYILYCVFCLFLMLVLDNCCEHALMIKKYLDFICFGVIHDNVNVSGLHDFYFYFLLIRRNNVQSIIISWFQWNCNVHLNVFPDSRHNFLRSVCSTLESVNNSFWYLHWYITCFPTSICSRPHMFDHVW